jgi:HPt (histidine-containing phosphotransfer) domain-containing protein
MALMIEPTVAENKLALLRQRFTSALPERIEALQAMLDMAASGSPMEDLERLLHRLAGSAGTYGLPEISCIAAGGERLCRDETVPRYLRIAAVSAILEELRSSCFSLERTSDAD